MYLEIFNEIIRFCLRNFFCSINVEIYKKTQRDTQTHTQKAHFFNEKSIFGQRINLKEKYQFHIGTRDWHFSKHWHLSHFPRLFVMNFLKNSIFFSTKSISFCEMFDFSEKN